ncbi:hypothetical protein B0T26DRAFT_793698, partial [Lasiosphaeria miniovina]
MTRGTSRVVQRLSFDIDCSYLHTNVGIYTIYKPSLSPTGLSATSMPASVSMAAPGPFPQHVNRWRDGFTEDKAYVLWLPPIYRPGWSDAQGSTLAIGCPTGQVFLLAFSHCPKKPGYYGQQVICQVRVLR